MGGAGPAVNLVDGAICQAIAHERAERRGIVEACAHG